MHKVGSREIQAYLFELVDHSLIDADLAFETFDVTQQALLLVTAVLQCLL